MSKKQAKSKDFLSDGLNLPKVEKRILDFWESDKIFEKSLGKQGKKKAFVFYEGPPYANGKPGIHHVLARIVKDIILRYKTMRGFHVPRKAGWDTHGLPVEIAAEKALGLKTKADIEKFGVQKFNDEAKKAVWLYKAEWERLTERIGYWLDLKNAYVTYAADYIESIWWTLQRIAERKLLYKGHKVVPWCARCGTALSSHELAQGYKEVVDASVYMKFQLKPEQQFGKYKTKDSAYILSWTTTPWTLPGNVALAVGEKISYTALRANGTPELLILASELVGIVFKDNQVEIVHDDIRGKDLVGLEYEPLFKIPSLKNDAAHKVYAADFVTTTDGTGVVHTAVMYGEEDYKLGIEVGLPQRHTVTEEGVFTKDVPDVHGLPVKAKETEQKIFEYLERHGYLLRTEEYAHEYPHCWRCGTPVLYFARDSWFIAMSKLRKELLASNKAITWQPAHTKEGRFGEWLTEVKDWNLSRERYWGVPLPIWECIHCKTHDVIGSYAELAERIGRARNTYFIMRHGESQSNVRGIIDSGQQKFSLTTLGRDQARRTGKKLKKEGIDVIVASDVLRAKETAELVAQELGVKVAHDKRLREVDLGVLTGKSNDMYWRVLPTYQERMERGPEGGESLRDVRKRAWSLISELERKHKDKKILLVAHECTALVACHVASGWTEREAIKEGNARNPKDFIGLAEVRPLEVKLLPRDETGLIDPHRPFVDAIEFPCAKCKKPMHRVSEVADVWYDSGAMPYAQDHWPFDMAQDSKPFASGKSSKLPQAYPADYISEAIDQTRGWFYTLLAIATALGNPAPYKNVVCLGLINDKHGQKMSKSKGNIVEPFAIIDKYGVDAVRWYFYTSSPLGEPKNFDETEVGKAYRRFHLILYNSLIFLQTYAKPGTKRHGKSANVLDQWILVRLDETTEKMTAHLDTYEMREAALVLETFTDDLSRWYIRRSRRRLQRPESAADFAAASATLHHVLLASVKLAAPFTPFFAEAMYQELRAADDLESVHMTDWPLDGARGKPLSALKKKLVTEMAKVRRVASAALAKRAELVIKVRQPLAELRAKGKPVTKNLVDILQDEVNVKKIVFDPKQKEEVTLDTTITPELRAEGYLRALVRTVQGLRQDAKFKPQDTIALMLKVPANLQEIFVEHEAVLKKEIGAKSVSYKKEKRLTAELSTKLDGYNIWLAVRKIR